MSETRTVREMSVADIGGVAYSPGFAKPVAGCGAIRIVKQKEKRNGKGDIIQIISNSSVRDAAYPKAKRHAIEKTKGNTE